jgi:hypothetical protein
MALPKSKVDFYEAIRCDARAGLSFRALMREYYRNRDRGTRLEAYQPLIDERLRSDDPVSPNRRAAGGAALIPQSHRPGAEAERDFGDRPRHAGPLPGLRQVWNCRCALAGGVARCAGIRAWTTSGAC